MSAMTDTTPNPREAATLPGHDLASWIVARIEGSSSSRMRAGLLDDIEAAIGHRDHARVATAAAVQTRREELIESIEAVLFAPLDPFGSGRVATLDERLRPLVHSRLVEWAADGPASEQ